MLFLVVNYSCHQSHWLIYFAILDFVCPQPLSCSVMDQKLIFICVNYLEWGFNFDSKITVNIFFNNRQTAKRYCLWGKCYWFSEMSKNEINNMSSLSYFLRKYPMWNILTEWCSSNIDKILRKTCKGVYYFSEVAD